MIKKLEEKLQLEIAAREKAIMPYNKRIKDLKTAIASLKSYNAMADSMNARTPHVAQKIEEIQEKK